MSVMVLQLLNDCVFSSVPPSALSFTKFHFLLTFRSIPLLHVLSHH
jgi:hypothetical protein